MLMIGSLLGVGAVTVGTAPIAGATNPSVSMQICKGGVIPTGCTPNWAGLVITDPSWTPNMEARVNLSFFQVESSFIVPKVKCAAADTNVQAISIWTGIGGYMPNENNSLLQDGISGQCNNGVFSGWGAFYETDPLNGATDIHMALPVKVGDQMDFLVNVPSPDKVDFAASNYSRDKSVSISTTYTGPTPSKSAECIVERSAIPGGGYADLPQFTPDVTFGDRVRGLDCYSHELAVQGANQWVVQCDIAYSTACDPNTTFTAELMYRKNGPQLANVSVPVLDTFDTFDVSWLHR
jgi:hypothetical protein